MKRGLVVADVLQMPVECFLQQSSVNLPLSRWDGLFACRWNVKKKNKRTKRDGHRKEKWEKRLRKEKKKKVRLNSRVEGKWPLRSVTFDGNRAHFSFFIF